MTVALAACAAAAAATSAHAYIYIADTNSNTIDRATNDGTLIQYGFIQGASNPAQVVVTATHVYWLNDGDGSIGEANIDGSGANPDFIPDAFGTAGGIAVDGSHIYWTNYQSSTAYIGRANLDGSDADNQWISNVAITPAGGIAVDSSYLYWGASYESPYYTPDYSIGRVDLDGNGGNPQWVDVPTDYTPGQMVTTGGYLFFANGAYVGRVGTTGTGLDTSYGQAPGGAIGVATDGSHLYWTPNGDYNGQEVDRANPDGTGFLNPFFTTTAYIHGMAADTLVPPAEGWPATNGGGGSGGGTGGGSSGGGSSGGGAGGGSQGSGSGSGGGTTPASQPAACVVPKLRGMTLAAAKTALAHADCHAGKVTRRRMHGVKRGRVAKSNPGAGKHLGAGASVALVVAR